MIASTSRPARTLLAIGAFALVVALAAPGERAAKAFVSPSVGLRSSRCPVGMTLLPEGSFTLAQYDLAATVSAFCLDVNEVTVEAYASCVKQGKCTPAGAAEFPGSVHPACNQEKADRRDHPVNCVDMMQAQAFCAMLGRRLPSEEEWEWAARGGSRGWKYPWGDAAPQSHACWNGDGNDLGMGKRFGTCVVGTFPSGDDPWGVHDLAGNVKEWVTGKYNPLNPVPLFRGGGWNDTYASSLGAGFRDGYDPIYRNVSVGFRCAWSP